MPKRGTITVRYESDEDPGVEFSDTFPVMIDTSGLWPAGESGPTPHGLAGSARTYYALGQALVRRVAELAR